MLRKEFLTSAPTSHGCDLETSLYLYLDEDLVDMKKSRLDGLNNILTFAVKMDKKQQ